MTALRFQTRGRHPTSPASLRGTTEGLHHEAALIAGTETCATQQRNDQAEQEQLFLQR